MYDCVIFVDDPKASTPSGNSHRIGPDGCVHQYTFAAELEDEADMLEGRRNAYSIALAGELRRIAAQARAADCKTPESWLALRSRVRRRA